MTVRSAPAAEPADIVFVDAVVWTGTDVRAATAVAVAEDRIVYVGDDAGVGGWVGPETRRVSLRGGIVLPGLVDAHAHLASLGESLRIIDLTGTRSPDEVVARVRAAAASGKPAPWVMGRGWDQNDWPDTSFPTFQDLEGAATVPVVLERIDGHALWINAAAMEECGVRRETRDPSGGRILRDAGGAPNGILVDEAMRLVLDNLPAVTGDELDERLRLAIAACNRAGLVGVHDAGTASAVMESLRRLGARGELTLNVYALVDSDEPAFARACMRRGQTVELGGRLVTRGVKLRADGALGSRGAALLADYSDEPGNTGLLVDPGDSLLAWTRESLAAGFQVATHAIGDRGNRVTLGAYETALGAVPVRDARLRIEHCQIIAPDDMARFARLGVIASMQPTHATSDMHWAEARVGSGRLAGAYAWRSLLEAGAVLAFGSDFPVESVNPLWGLYAAVTRQDHEGAPAGGWRPSERITLDEALRAFTWGAAYAAFDEAGAGTIAVGKRADLTILDRDVTASRPRALLDARVAFTVVRGAIVFESGGY